MTTITPPNLGTIIASDLARRIIYGTYGGLVIIAGASQTYELTTTGLTPLWLTGTLAVLVYLGVPVSGLAIANAKTKGVTPVSNIVTNENGNIATAPADGVEEVTVLPTDPKPTIELDGVTYTKESDGTLVPVPVANEDPAAPTYELPTTTETATDETPVQLD